MRKRLTPGRASVTTLACVAAFVSCFAFTAAGRAMACSYTGTSYGIYAPLVVRDCACANPNVTVKGPATAWWTEGTVNSVNFSTNAAIGWQIKVNNNAGQIYTTSGFTTSIGCATACQGTINFSKSGTWTAGCQNPVITPFCPGQPPQYMDYDAEYTISYGPYTMFGCPPHPLFQITGDKQIGTSDWTSGAP